MGTSKAGFILGLIGGILGILSGLIVAVFSKHASLLANLSPAFGVARSIGMIVAIWSIISGALVIWFSTWMKKEEKCFTGGLLTLIFSIIGSGTILGIVGGILGIVEGKKK